jgi:hypothetical protein
LAAIGFSTAISLLTDNAFGDRGVWTFDAETIVAVVFFVSLLTESREARFGTLDTDIVDIAEGLVLIFGGAHTGWLVGFWTFDAFVLFAIRHTRADVCAGWVVFGCFRFIVALHTEVIFARQAIAICRIHRIPLRRALSAFVIYTVFEVSIEFLATGVSGESGVWTFATLVLRTERAVGVVIVTGSRFISCYIIVFTFAALIEGTVRFFRIKVVAIRGVSTSGRAIRTTGIDALVIDADLTRRTMIIGHTIPRLALVLITDLIVAVRSLGCRIIRTPALRTAGIFDTTVAIATGGLSHPLGTSRATDLDFVAIGTTAQGSGGTNTGSTSVVEAVLTGRTGVEVIPSIAIGIADLDSSTRTAAGSR